MNDHTQQKKMPRQPMYTQQVSSIAVRPGYRRRLVNEVEGKVEQMELAGYTLVRGKDELNHDKTAHTESQQGSVCRRVVNYNPTAAARTAVWMEIPEELYIEDQEAKVKQRCDKLKQLDPRNYKQEGADYGYMNYSQ
jgi:hypothetical protein